MSKSDNDTAKLVTSDSLTTGMSEGEKDELSSLFDSETVTVDVSKIAVLSDIHSNMVAFEAVLEDLKTQEYDILLNLGDLVGYYTQPNEVIEEAIELFDYGVMGNHDFAVIEPEDLMFSTLNKNAKHALAHNKETLNGKFRSYLIRQPMKLILQTPFGDITAVHGDPLTIFGYIYGKSKEEMESEILNALSHAETEFLFVGHTHIQGYFQAANGQTYLNPGAVGQPRDRDNRAAYAIIDLAKKSVDLRRVEYDISKVQQQVHECNFPKTLGERLQNGV